MKDSGTLTSALETLGKEIKPDPEEDWHADSAYRIHLVQASLYKTILKALGPQTQDYSLQSAAERELDRGISDGHQKYEVNPELWPVNKPMEKLEAKAQVSGTAQYVGDIPSSPDELHGNFVYTTVAACEIANVDTTEALVGTIYFLRVENIFTWLYSYA